MGLRKGFLISGKLASGRSGRDEIHLWARDEHGAFKLIFKDQKQVFFVEQSAQVNTNNVQCEQKLLDLKTFSGAPVKGLYFEGREKMLKAKDSLEASGIRTFESDVRPVERFLMERFIKGGLEVSFETETRDGGFPCYINPKIRPIQYNVEFSTLSLDIETGRDGRLYSIGLHYKYRDQIQNKVFMLADFSKDGEVDYLKYCSTEKEILESFFAWTEKADPDVILGWHVVGFDLKFLQNKCDKLGLKLKIGRNRGLCSISERRGSGYFANMPGRIILDGPPTLRGCFYSFENFKLETVAQELLGVGKDISSDMGKVEEIEHRFRNDKVALAKYNLLDCELVTKIFEKTELLELLQTRTRTSGLLVDKHGMSSAAFDFFMLPKIHRAGFVAPNVTDISRDAHAAGGYVLEPKAGMHEKVLVLDFKSLYPSIIRTFFIDPYSRIMSDNDTVETPTGHKFSRSNNLLPVFIKELMDKRAHAKKINDAPLSMAIKILMNSFYGVMGSSGSRFYHADLPTAITGTGQWLLKESISFFEQSGREVLYGDTDSVFVRALNENDDWKLEGERIAHECNEYLRLKLKNEFGVESHLVLEAEKSFDQIFFPSLRGSETGAKKKYVGMNETEGSPKLHFSGMEAVRSDWTKLAKTFQVKVFEKFFSNDPVEDYIKTYIADLKSGIFDGQLVYRKKLSKRPDEYLKNIPPHVRAAMQLPEERWRDMKYVEYIYTVTGPVPAELKKGQIDYSHYVDKQIRPIAETVLLSMGKNFDSLVSGNQLDLF